MDACAIVVRPRRVDARPLRELAAFVITSRVEALDQETGHVLWEIATPLPKVEEAVGTHDYLLLAGRGQLCAVRVSDGSLLWTARGDLAGVSLASEVASRAQSGG